MQNIGMSFKFIYELEHSFMNVILKCVNGIEKLKKKTIQRNQIIFLNMISIIKEPNLLKISVELLNFF